MLLNRINACKTDNITKQPKNQFDQILWLPKGLSQVRVWLTYRSNLNLVLGIAKEEEIEELRENLLNQGRDLQSLACDA